MNDPDLKYALLLQKQFDVESKLRFGDDSLLASELQDNFNHEFNCESAVGLSYDAKKKSKDDSRSLVDPSWELVDPTPNIHNLFVVFNQRFFWNKLLTVCVSWSKRMTTCAGICSYQGRGGLCSITLSEPLLKLRPRKDLIETLLHEMIHAFLFVTHNNRDREGHGPEFHKHMYRINKEAGTNITVYHSFHDEVRLYQQHWWRCNGPCQNRKPYFGMVRRAMNRPPGPTDRWWAQHQQNCGGTFIKVREPENPKSASHQKSAVPSKSNGDIRKYIKSPIKNNSVSSPKRSPKKTKPVISPNEDIRKYLTNSKSSGDSPKPNKSNDSPEIVAVFSNGNVHGFKDLGTGTRVKKNLRDTAFKNSNRGSVDIKSNNANTVVITTKQNSTSKSIEKKSEDTVPFSGTGRILSFDNATLDYNKVRDHWLKKYENSNIVTKRQASDEVVEGQKIKRPSVINVSSGDEQDFFTCPICAKKMQESLLNAHLDECLGESLNKINEKCYICNREVPKSEYKDHMSNCFNNSFGDDGLENLVECPVCCGYFDHSMIEQHTIDCIAKASKKNEDKADAVALSQCTVCDEFIEPDKLDVHQEQCLHKILDNIEKKYNLPNSNELINCLVCKKEVLKSELNSHLDECMSGVFDEKISEDATDDKEKPSCSKDYDIDKNKYNCPFCMDLYSELDMSGHLEECLRCGSEKNDDRSILIDSFSCDF